MSLLSDHARLTLVRLLKVAYPHASFPDGPYERTAEAVLAAAAADPRQLAQLLQGLSDLNMLSRCRSSSSATTSRSRCSAASKARAFFANVPAAAVVALYDDHEVWELLGYEGASFDQGGYLNRGFNDLDWLPEPKRSRVLIVRVLSVDALRL